MSTLTRWFRPALAAFVTAGAAVVLWWLSEQAKEKLEKRAAETAKTGIFDDVEAWNPLTWGNVPGNLFQEGAELVEISGLWIQARVLGAGMWAAIVIGGLVTLWFVWQDVLKTPEEKRDEFARDAMLIAATRQTGETTRTTVVPALAPQAAPVLADVPSFPETLANRAEVGLEARRAKEGLNDGTQG